MKHFNEDIDEVEIPYAHLDSMNYQAKRVISTAAHALFPGASVSLVGDIDTDSLLLSPKAIAEYPRAEWFVEAQMRRMFDLLPEFPDTYLFLDIETHNAEKRWDMPLESFFRLGQYAWGEGPIQTTTDLDEVLSLIDRAERVIAHNGHSFDFSVLLGNNALDLAFEGKLFDTYTYAKLKFPCPVTYTHANGTTYRSNTSPAQYRRWYGLDNLAFQFGSARKFGDLAALVAKYNPKGTPKSELDFSLVPIDDPDFILYAKQDIEALRELTRSMVAVGGLDNYDYRCQITDAIDAQMSRNGVLVDTTLAQARVEEAEVIKAEVLTQLERDYNFPTNGKMPWRTKAGKEAIERLLLDVGVDIHTPDWPKTSTGNPSLGGDALVEGTRGTPAESLGESLAILQGQRPLAAQALQYTSADGVMHPDIDALQRSGRRSVSKAGLTTWGSRSEAGMREKEYFIARPNRVLIEGDLSNADARAVAFMSQDKNRAKWFEPGADSHEIVGRLMFGDEVYDSDPQGYRTISKACIAEGELVLTDHGLVPIDKITTCMLLWDGLDWVTHGGLIDQGIREVITYDGLTATPDHIIFTEEGVEIPLGQAAKTHQKIARSGSLGLRDRVYKGTNIRGFEAVWWLYHSFSYLQKWSWVWLGRLAQSCNGKKPRVLEMLSREKISLSEVVGKSPHGRENEMRKSQQARVQELWSKGDRVHVRECSCWGALHLRKLFPAGSKHDHRQNRQQRSIWSRKHPHDNPECQSGQPSQHRFESLGSKILAFWERGCNTQAQIGHDPKRDNRGRKKYSGKQRQSLQSRPRKVRVYDIRDAGPRNRFTVSGRLVHNCNHASAYGAGAKKLSMTAGVDYEVAERFLSVVQTHYPDVIRWQNRVREEGLSGFVVNRWGRTMPVEIDRTHTQAPALMGQSSTTEVLYDGLIKLYHMDREYLNYILFPVHDAVLCEAPEDRAQEFADALRKSMYQVINDIEFTLETGTPGRTWKDAQH